MEGGFLLGVLRLFRKWLHGIVKLIMAMKEFPKYGKVF
jgi:hypothetical protein